jgi:septal ring factor EnvC (AmiA/AmiB activator)
MRATLVCLLCALGGVSHVRADGPLRAQTAAERAAERLKVLRREADELSTREQSLVGDLRRLELERQIRVTELAAIDVRFGELQAELAQAQQKTGTLTRQVETQRPDVAARLVRLYKMGRIGYWRLLLDQDDLRAIGRTYRTAATLARADADRAVSLERSSREIAEQRDALEARTTELAALRESAVKAQAALDQAVSERASLLKAVESRRELTLQLATELAGAQQKLEAFGAAAAPARPAPILPLKPFIGDLPWPANGIVLSRFGRQPVRGGLVVTRNGVEISLAEGRPVAAVHEGVVSFAAPFTGYANLVILDHGNGAQTVYGHLASVTVSKGGAVAAGTNVGLSGRNPAGNPALYFELRVDGKPVDPLQWLRKPL